MPKAQTNPAAAPITSHALVRAAIATPASRCLHLLHVHGDQFADRADGDLAVFCGDAARILERLFHLAGECQLKHLGAGFAAILDRGAEGLDQLALFRARGDGLKPIDRRKGGGGGLAVKFDMPLRDLFFVAEDDVLFADGGVVERALGLKDELHPGGVAIHQSRRGVGQQGHRQRGIKHDADRNDGDDGRRNGDLGDDRDITKSNQHIFSPIRFHRYRTDLKNLQGFVIFHAKMWVPEPQR
jgi:hypothetical protein